MALQLSGETLATEKTGAATATVSFHDKDKIPEVPRSHRGLILVKRDTRQQEDGSFVTVATYEGRNEDVQTGGGGGEGGATYAARENAVYEWSPSFETTDIAKHPDIDYLLSRYDGTVDEATGAVIWPQELRGGGGGGLDSESSGGTNPMFGVTSFLSLGGVWSETVFEQSLPGDAFDSGVITGSPSGGPPTPSGRFWLSMPPMVVSHGDGFKVTRRWMLSGVSSARDVLAAQDIYGSGGGPQSQGLPNDGGYAGGSLTGSTFME
jgi:hypothetical protein